VTRLCAALRRPCPRAVRIGEFRALRPRGCHARAHRLPRRNAGKCPVPCSRPGIHPGESDGKARPGASSDRRWRRACSRTALPGCSGAIAILFVAGLSRRWARALRPLNRRIRTVQKANRLAHHRHESQSPRDTPRRCPEIARAPGADPHLDRWCAPTLARHDGGRTFNPTFAARQSAQTREMRILTRWGASCAMALIASSPRSARCPSLLLPDLARTDDPASGSSSTVYSPRSPPCTFPQRKPLHGAGRDALWTDYARACA